MMKKSRAGRRWVEDNGGKRRIAIACQGGGSHTAFTAGALRKILEEIRDERSYEIVAFSGTSGGAVCAFLAWYALLKENNEQAAIRALRSFWTEDNAAYLRVGDLSSIGDVLTNDLLSTSTHLRRSWEATFGVGFNPELNPYRYHDLFDYWRRRLKEAIEKNLKAIDPRARQNIDQSIANRVSESEKDLRLFVGAVNALTGDFKVFTSHQKKRGKLAFNDEEEDRVGVDAVLASAAIPTVFEATRTGEAVYWDPSRRPDERAYVGEGVYWDGLYSQNPPVRDLREADPHEIWVIQINPEEIGAEPKRTVEIEDRRNELSGNTSLNQELYFVRKINELVKQLGEWVYDHDGILRKVLCIPPPCREDQRMQGQEKYGTVKVRRLELSMPLDASSKLDRRRSHIRELMEHGARQAERFLSVVPSQIALEETWDNTLRTQEEDNVENVDDVMDFFAERPVVQLITPWDATSGPSSRDQGWETDDPQDVRAVLLWCLANKLTLEQSRDYQVREGRLGRRVITCWVLATADPLQDPIKGRAVVEVGGGKVERLTFYPLSSKVARELVAQIKELASSSRNR
jgi:NTE family protein